jgi:glucose/arabinose dehydrogenase
MNQPLPSSSGPALDGDGIDSLDDALVPAAAPPPPPAEPPPLVDPPRRPRRAWRPVLLLATLGAVYAVVANADSARLAVADGMGPNPVLPPPTRSLLPTVEVAPAVGWKKDAKPVATDGLEVHAFAIGLVHPRWLYVLPNGDVLVAETNAPDGRDDSHGIKGWITSRFMAKAGAAVPSPNRITLLRDANRDGDPELSTTFLSGLNSPLGMAVAGNYLYVANTDALVRYPYKRGMTEIKAAPEKVVDLPAGPINHHWTKNVIANRDGSRLYVTVGSNSNVAENGIENEQSRAAILEVDPNTGTTNVFATGLRNPNGLAWEPKTGALWTVVNERDEIGSDLVPDYLTSVQQGGFYGWPYSYFGGHVDERVTPQRPDLVERALVPDYALGPHTASLGLTFYTASALPERFRGGAFVGQHGSWNRKPLSGYKVIYVPFADGKPSGPAEDVLTGFVNGEGDANGRPVGVTVDAAGALLVADDVGNAIWRITAAKPPAAATPAGDPAPTTP